MSRNKRHRNQPDNVRSPGPASPAASRREPPRRRFRWLVPGIAALGFVAIAWDAWIGSKPPPQAVSATAPAAAKPDASATFVGAKACAECHAGEAAKWEGSQHAHAMQHATEATVLGNFNGAKFNYNGIVSTFYRRDGKFFVNTDGADGKLADFEVSYTFGLYPLQQYLVAFP